MRFWTPEPDAPHLLDWWAPLVRAARRALDETVPWLIVIDEWALTGRVERRGRPDVWVYRHRGGGGDLCVDDTGQPYRFIPSSSGPSLGRFTPIDIRPAVWRAGLPTVGQAVFFEWPFPMADGLEWDDPPVDNAEPPVRRAALHLVR